MYQRTITKATLTAFHRHLQEAERRPATIAKYLREVQDFARHLEPGQPVEKETVLAWKAALARRYAAGTVNGKLAALNTFFAFLGQGVEPWTMVGQYRPDLLALLTLALFFAIYLLYILLAYHSLKRNVLPEE